LIPFTPRARRQFSDLLRYYEDLGRPEAMLNLEAARLQASAAIESGIAAGLPSPRPYPTLARPGRTWLKAGRYWFAYRTSPQPAIVAVFYETANIPQRL